jgi:hypothetical protein
LGRHLFNNQSIKTNNYRIKMYELRMSGIALKAKKQYATYENSNWYCFYHALSGDAIGNQICSIFYGPTNQENSWAFETLSEPYKIQEDEGIYVWVLHTYKGVAPNDAWELVGYVKQFLNDACDEFNRKPICTL